MADVVDDEHREAAAGYRRLWAAYEENRDLILMGAYRPGNDPVIDEAVRRRQDILNFIRQDQKSRVDLITSADALVAGFGA
jgi:flagellum-specific ATP synthase